MSAEPIPVPPSSPADPPAPAPSAKSTTIKCLLLLALAALVLFAAGYAYQLVKQYDWLRTNCMVAIIVSGLAAAICLAGVIHYANLFLTAIPRPWYFRWLFFHIKQLFLLAQILATALALAAAGILIFHFKIP